MCNHLCEEVLNSDMLHLMEEMVKIEKDSCADYDSTLDFLRSTSILVDIFTNINCRINNMRDPRIKEVSDVLEFFNKWNLSSRTQLTLESI